MGKFSLPAKEKGTPRKEPIFGRGGGAFLNVEGRDDEEEEKGRIVPRSRRSKKGELRREEDGGRCLLLSWVLSTGKSLRGVKGMLR